MQKQQSEATVSAMLLHCLLLLLPSLLNGHSGSSSIHSGSSGADFCLAGAMAGLGQWARDARVGLRPVQPKYKTKQNRALDLF